MKVLGLTILLILVQEIKSDKMSSIMMEDTFDTLKLLKGLRDIDNSSICGKHIAEYFNGLQNDEYWASVMFDSSAKTPNGIFRGNIKNMGNFDECIQAHHPENRFTGQHCMVDMFLALNSKSNDDIFRLILPYEDKYEFHKLWKIQFGLCLPSTCTTSEISKGINSVLNKTVINKHVFSVQLDQENCSTKQWRKIPDTAWISIGILIFMGFTTVISTAIDLYQRSIPAYKPNSLLLSFSLYTNSRNLFKISHDSEELKMLHGIRVLSMCWVVLYHTCGSIWLDGPPVNLFESIKTYKDLNHVVIVNGFISVDTFLFMSGMLVSMGFYRSIRKKRYYDAPLALIHRYLRLTPSYAFVILITSNIFIYMGNGPLWNLVNKIQVENCKKNWWAGILYIQNFINPSSICLGQSWYLSADMQMHLISPIILYSIYFWPKNSGIILAIAILSAFCTNFTVAYTYGLGASLYTTNNFRLQWETDYVNFYTRASPYLFGITMGYIVSRIQAGKLNITLKKYSVIIGWIVSTGLCLFSLYGTVPFTESTQSTLKTALFLAFHRVSWSAGLAYIVLACMQGYGGPVHAILSWQVFQPFSKLSYNVYLIHINVQLYRLGSLRTNTYAGDTELIYTFLGDLILSYILAIPFSLIFEMPFNNIDKYFLQDLKILPIPRISTLNEKSKNINEINRKNNLNTIMAEENVNK